MDCRESRSFTSAALVIQADVVSGVRLPPLPQDSPGISAADPQQCDRGAFQRGSGSGARKQAGRRAATALRAVSAYP